MLPAEGGSADPPVSAVAFGGYGLSRGPSGSSPGLRSSLRCHIEGLVGRPGLLHHVLPALMLTVAAIGFWMVHRQCPIHRSRPRTVGIWVGTGERGLRRPAVARGPHDGLGTPLIPAYRDRLFLHALGHRADTQHPADGHPLSYTAADTANPVYDRVQQADECLRRAVRSA